MTRLITSVALHKRPVKPTNRNEIGWGVNIEFTTAPLTYPDELYTFRLETYICVAGPIISLKRHLSHFSYVRCMKIWSDTHNSSSFWSPSKSPGGKALRLLLSRCLVSSCKGKNRRSERAGQSSCSDANACYSPFYRQIYLFGGNIHRV